MDVWCVWPNILLGVLLFDSTRCADFEKTRAKQQQTYTSTLGMRICVSRLYSVCTCVCVYTCKKSILSLLAYVLQAYHVHTVYSLTHTHLLVPYVCAILSMVACSGFWVTRGSNDSDKNDLTLVCFSTIKLSSKTRQADPTTNRSEIKVMQP